MCIIKCDVGNLYVGDRLTHWVLVCLCVGVWGEELIDARLQKSHMHALTLPDVENILNGKTAAVTQSEWFHGF